MHRDQIEEVWTMVDRGALAALAHRGPEPVFATISGAHLYGFASPDSDVDLRGAFLLPARALLGLRRAQETISIQERDGAEIDWVAHDLPKFARLLTRHNGYVLEQLFSPLVVVSTPSFEELRELGRRCVTRPTVRHYQGFARGRRQRLQEPGATVKHLLYAYRVLLTGIHLMRTGEVVSNATVLSRELGIDAIDELVARKRAGAEAMLLEEGEIAHHDALLDRLEAMLTEAHDRSSLPEEPPTKALDDFVVRVRMAAAREEP